MRQNCKGNVLVYVLLAVGLLAALTYALSRDGGGQATKPLSEAQALLYADRMINQATAARIAVTMLQEYNVDPDSWRYQEPSQAGFENDPSVTLYHPRGGGLEYFKTIDDATDTGSGTHFSHPGWWWQNLNNLEWSPSATTDITFNYNNVREEVCAAINKRLIGTSDIPMTTISNFKISLTPQGGSNPDVTTSSCPECETNGSICLGNGQTYAFYNMMLLR